MFESNLKERLERIFDFKKVRFDDPGESLEQETLFVNIESARCDINEKKQRAQVKGQCFVFANQDKLPYGYFNKRIINANADDSMRFFFYEIDHNAPVMNNIARRSFRFVFFYDAQYDPSLGTITSIEFSTEGD